MCLLLNETVLPGKVPGAICPIFFGAKLIALSKKEGGIRPIAVELTLRRLASKLLLNKFKEQGGKKFLPFQVGVGIPSGAEAAIHSLRKFVKKPANGKYVLVKVDFQNAFRMRSKLS